MLALHLVAITAGLVTERPALLEDQPAVLLDGVRQTAHQLKRIEVATLGVEQTRLIALAADPLRQLFPGHELQAVIAPLLRGLLLPLMQMADPPGQHRGPQVPGAVVDIETMALR